jgi:flagellar hook capping protein FlgD
MKKTLLFFVVVSLFTIVNAEMILELNSANSVNMEQTRNDPPTNVLATLVNYNDVQLTWMEPGAASILWDQIDPEGETYGKSAQDFEASFDQYDAEVAGDFVLNGDAEITGAAFNFFYNEAGWSDPVPFNVWIFEDNNGVPEETPIHGPITTEAVLPDEFQVYEVEFDTPFTLTAGTYWIGFNMTLSYNPTSVQCYANQKVTVINETVAYWRNPGNGFDTGFTTWSPDINSQGGTPEDITFQIHGNYTAAGNRELMGYNVFRNDVQVNTALITDTDYDDMGLDAGAYDYHIIAVYDDGDSSPSNTSSVDVTLSAPSGFSANLAGANVVCQWQAPASRDLTGYRIYRNDEMVGESTSNFFVDQAVPAGLLIYHVTAVYGVYESDPSNTIEINNTDSEDNIIPAFTEFNGNYPNPFNPTTYLSYSLSEASHVTIEIFNSKGQLVNILVNEVIEAGNYSTLWNGVADNGEKVPSGIYFSKFNAGDFTSTKKMILMK